MKDGIAFSHFSWYKFSWFCMCFSSIFVVFFSWLLILSFSIIRMNSKLSKNEPENIQQVKTAYLKRDLKE